MNPDKPMPKTTHENPNPPSTPAPGAKLADHYQKEKSKYWSEPCDTCTHRHISMRQKPCCECVHNATPNARGELQPPKSKEEAT